MTPRSYAKSRALAERARALIPGGAHTYSKGEDQFPTEAPGFIARGVGCRVFDVDDNEFLDWGMGLRSVILGHADPAVLRRVNAELARGSNFTRPSPIELELAELLSSLVPSAQMVKLAKNGSDVTTAAVRLARAHTGRDEIAVCRDHPFFSVHDWFIATTPVDAGIPTAGRELIHGFGYNDAAGLERLLDARAGRIAAVVLEPAAADVPAAGFLERVRAVCDERGVVLIFDEMITGLRWSVRGAQHTYGVTPDLSTFGKAIANGFSVSALVGRRDIMRRGGLDHDDDRVFLLSSTHGGETHAIAAAIATLTEMRDRDGCAHLAAVGAALVDGITAAARDAGVADIVRCKGVAASPVLVIADDAGMEPLTLRTLFLQETIARGVLMPYIAPSMAHTQREVDETLDAVRAAFGVVARARADGAARFLRGRNVKPVFRRRA